MTYRVSSQDDSLLKAESVDDGSSPEKGELIIELASYRCLLVH